jgi:NRPS condensation-like uncharacterized protein
MEIYRMDKLPILNERLFLRSPSINVCFRIILKGIFDKNQIENALKKVCIKHPLLNSFIELDNDNNAWFIQDGTSPGIKYFESSEIDWQTWYRKADNVPFDFLQGPLVNFCVIIGGNTEIIILGHHIIGDGIAYLNLAKDVLLALDNNIDISPQIPPLMPAGRKFKKTVPLSFLSRMYARKLNKKWRKTRVRFSEDDYQEFFKQYRIKYSPNLYVASIEGEDLKTLLERSKSNGLTVNEIIASAFSVAMMKNIAIYSNKEIRLGVAADIRSDLVSEPYNCMGNYVTGILAKVDYDPSKNFISNAKSISEILRDQLKDIKTRHLAVHFLNKFDKDLIESTMFAAYGKFEHQISKRLAELIGEQSENKGLGISNLGRHDLNNYETINLLDMQFIGPAFPANLLSVSIITINNKLNICIQYNEGEIGLDKIKSIYEKAIELLK